MTDATDDYLSAEEVEALTGEQFPLDAELPDDFPPDEGDADVSDDEAAETGVDSADDGDGDE